MMYHDKIKVHFPYLSYSDLQIVDIAKNMLANAFQSYGFTPADIRPSHNGDGRLTLRPYLEPVTDEHQHTLEEALERAFGKTSITAGERILTTHISPTLSQDFSVSGRPNTRKRDNGRVIHIAHPTPWISLP